MADGVVGAARALVIGVLAGTADMPVPASIVGGIGTILYYFQNAGTRGESWSYLWTLIPGFVEWGCSSWPGSLAKRNKKEIVDGIQAMLVSGVLLVFGSLMGESFNQRSGATTCPCYSSPLGLLCAGACRRQALTTDRPRQRAERSLETAP